ncbi:Alpha/beta-hydrolase [Mycena venus]|uniref:Alpha/beta-hydrolase n=1 Tax=Mycena venus TaxID=2733690 RepID=A0A8H6YGJ5_9AGAR|nr:Alpha/beta-hydrolase [Mycena venus]
MSIFISIFALAAVLRCTWAAPTFSLEVPTTSGVLHGFVDPSAPAVRQFLGVPFAQPPTGALRWLPPVMLTNSTSSVNATNIGPSCPQIPLSQQALPDVFSPKGGNQTEFFPIENFSEDCLTLNVWAPVSPQSQKLPVLVWFFGGGFVTGGTSALYYNPTSWIQRTQAHIVVSVNFRSNIFGFPNAAGLPEQNLGVLDQRASLEWVRANIEAFGGDAAHIVSWGESAGAIATDFLHFAFPDDPIVCGSIMESGTALFPAKFTLSSDTAQVNFAGVAKQLGCAPGAGQVDCLRGVAWQDIEALLAANTSTPSFLPIADGHIIFSDYKARYTGGQFSRIPALIGTNEHELNALQPESPDQDKAANEGFLCPAAETAQLRQVHGLTTYRYRYDGNFTDISPPAFTGAYHASELPLVFGTAGKFHGPTTSYEDAVGATLQDLWLDFARDPQNGLQRVGWESFGAGKAVLLGGEDAALKVIDVQELDGVCSF